MKTAKYDSFIGAIVRKRFPVRVSKPFHHRLPVYSFDLMIIIYTYIFILIQGYGEQVFLGRVHATDNTNKPICEH